MNRATLTQRFIAFLIDNIIIFSIAIPAMNYNSEIMLDHPNIATSIVILLNFLFLSKDMTGQSPGKKIMKIEIVDKIDSYKPSFKSLFIRNMYLGLGIIEVAVILLDKNHERIGDKATGTIVVQAADF